jgi:hypothetical protein
MAFTLAQLALGIQQKEGLTIAIRLTSSVGAILIARVFANSIRV